MARSKTWALLTAQYPEVEVPTSNFLQASCEPGRGWSYAWQLIVDAQTMRYTESHTQQERGVPFCLTLSKEPTRSEREPGNAVGAGGGIRVCVWGGAGCCDVDGDLCPPIVDVCCGGANDDDPICSFCGTLTPGGNCGCCERFGIEELDEAFSEYCCSC